VFSDILEHLKRPDIVLKKAKNWLKPDGYVVANVPNAVRIEYRLKILLGKFEYGRNLGQHPPTHLRFFTLKSVKQLFQESGYKIQRIEPTGLGDKLKILHGLFSWSFIVVAKPINRVRLLSPP
jgi:2-polyprenyl-3-methyl-5-hydroxy-6-metoxy-1,4-benzoquinol methylase